jgi:hypothetical protein
MSATSRAGNERPASPVWLRALAAAVLALLGGALAYTAAIAVANLSRIGV